MSEVEPGVVAELSISDHSQLGPLAEYLRLTTPGARVTHGPGRSGRGEQGALDVLMIAADSSVIVAAVKAIPEFLRSRKKGMSVTIATKGKRLTVTTDNAEEAMPIIDRFLNG